MDLFENTSTLPLKVRQIVSEMEAILNSTANDHYAILKTYQDKLRKYGYSFSYGLDAVPYDLINKVKVGDFVFDDVVTDTDEAQHQWAHICENHSSTLEDNGFDVVEGGGATCGIEGCQNESLFYVDF